MKRRWLFLLAMITIWLGLQMTGRDPRQSVAQDNGGNGVVGTWYSESQFMGGINRQWWTYAPDGSYFNVSIMQGGVKNGQEVQRFGHYRAQMTGPNQLQIAIHLEDGAPKRVCAAGQGCTPINMGSQDMIGNYIVHGNEMQMTSDGSILRRGSVPAQLQQRISDTQTQRPFPTIPSGGGHTKNPNGMPDGVGGNCDNAQQARICHINNGHMYKDTHGCMVCAAP